MSADINIPPLLFSAQITPTEDTGPRRFTGVAYHGGMIPKHYHWGDLVFDLDALDAKAPAPLLVEHDRNQRAGVIEQFGVGPEGLTVSGYLLDNDTGRGIAVEADAGFPWQMSVHIEPTLIESLKHGDAIINGQQFSTPLTVFRANSIREVSLTPTGADKHTRATIFTHQPQEATVADSETHDEAGTLAALEQRIADLLAENETLRAQFAARVREDRVQQFVTKTGKQIAPADADVIGAMTDQQFALLLDAAQPVHVPDAKLFSEQAREGAPPDLGATLIPTPNLYAARAAAARGDV